MQVLPSHLFQQRDVAFLADLEARMQRWSLGADGAARAAEERVLVEMMREQWEWMQMAVAHRPAVMIELLSAKLMPPTPPGGTPHPATAAALVRRRGG